MVAEASETVLIEKRDGVGLVTLNRPDRLNAMSTELIYALVEGLNGLAADRSVHCVVLTGAGRAFCAGGDIQAMTTQEPQTFEEGVEEQQEFHQATALLHNMRKPTIAMINGHAVGAGLSLALACDLRIASDQAKLGQTFNRIGLHPDWGGTYFLPRLVGPAKALELMWLADVIDAPECLRLGLFNRVVPHAQLASATREIAAALAVKPALSLALNKRAVYDTMEHSLGEMLDYELDAQIRCFKSGDAREGIRAFVEKRAPQFASQ